MVSQIRKALLALSLLQGVPLSIDVASYVQLPDPVEPVRGSRSLGGLLGRFLGPGGCTNCS